MTYQLIYSSVSAMPMEQEALQHLLQHAQRANRQRGITGALVYANGDFLQILEGERSQVQALMQRIATDLRHESIGVLQQGEIPAPQFASWEMAFVSATPEQVAHWLGVRSRARMPDMLDDMRRSRAAASQVVGRILESLLGGAGPRAVSGASPVA